MRLPLALAALLALAPGCGVTTDAPSPARVEAPDRCGQCHLREYRRARRPRHVGHLPTTCGVCHLESTWRTTTLRHEWPLTGAHVAAPCAGCHAGATPRYRGTPTACVGCHADDARAVRRPSHERFPTTCGSCHRTRAWSPTFERDEAPEAPTPEAPAPAPAPAPRPATPAPRPATPAPRPATPAPRPATPAARTHPESRFAITRGNHADIECADCHRRPGANGRGNTDCVHCHPRSRWDPVHDGVRSYPTGAAAANFCVTCHARGTRSRR
ncbi:MAG: cytochrome c3 family protein [Polyangiales bacterium]